MLMNIFCITITLIVLVGSATSTMQEEHDEAWKEADVDGDGFIELEELKEVLGDDETTVQMFDCLESDEDVDNKVSKEEFDQQYNGVITCMLGDVVDPFDVDHLDDDQLDDDLFEKMFNEDRV